MVAGNFDRRAQRRIALGWVLDAAKCAEAAEQELGRMDDPRIVAVDQALRRLNRVARELIEEVGQSDVA